jgi:hypothetical protein
MRKKTNGILVTGAPRSGTTWVGRMIALTPYVNYLHEPFNNTFIREAFKEDPFPYWFMYINHQNGEDYYIKLARMLGYKYKLSKVLKWSRNWENVKLCAQQWRQSLYPGKDYTIPLVKDPIAVLSSEWLANVFDLDVIFLVRHPAAFVASITALRWETNPRTFLLQSLLVKDHLEPLVDDIQRIGLEGDEIDKASMTWKTIYFTAKRFRERHPSWIFRRHEDLANDPITSFKHLFSSLNLDFTQEIETEIVAHSDTSNPVEPDHYWQVRRNSNGNIDKWRNQLQEADIERIRGIVEDVSADYYDDFEW